MIPQITTFESVVAKGSSSAAHGIPDEVLSKKTKRSRRSWKKPKGKPNRPLSAYNLFFQVERERLLKHGTQGIPDDNLKCEYTPEEVTRMSQWHKVRPRRPHRKTHGKISFHEMSRLISVRWKALGEASRQIFINQAKQEKKEYMVKVKAWEEQEAYEKMNFFAATKEEEQEILDINEFLSDTSTQDSQDIFGLQSSFSSLESLESLDKNIGEVLDFDLGGLDVEVAVDTRIRDMGDNDVGASGVDVSHSGMTAFPAMLPFPVPSTTLDKISPIQEVHEHFISQPDNTTSIPLFNDGADAEILAHSLFQSPLLSETGIMPDVSDNEVCTMPSPSSFFETSDAESPCFSKIADVQTADSIAVDSDSKTTPASLFKTSNELMLVLSVTHHHQKLFGSSDNKDEKEEIDLLGAIEEGEMDLLFND